MVARRFALVLVTGSFAACDRKTPGPDVVPSPAIEAPPPAGTPETKAAAAKSVSVSELPICKTPDDPLAAICKLGAPAMEARFECATPEPLAFCGAFDEWTCRYMSFAGETPPPVTYHARFDHEGPPVKSGDIIDTASYERKGVVRGIAVHVEETDDAAGRAKAARWSSMLTSWGCTVFDEFGETKLFSCGTWEAKTTYNEIIDHAIFEVALTGFRECKG